MPLIDLHCTLGTTPATRALPSAESSATIAAAQSYADRFDVKTLCFSAAHASSDFKGGLAELLELLVADKRFQGWLTLSIHQPELAAQQARSYLVKPEFCGTIIEQNTDADVLTSQGGREVLNALRRYSKPVLVTISSPATLEAAIHAAREFSTLRFLFSPQDEYLTRISIPAMKEAINTLFLPVAAYAERDIVAQAVQTLGERRVGWASNWGQLHPAAAIGMIRDSALTAPQRERVGLKNAAELLGR